jgi:hypothetical protein
MSGISPQQKEGSLKKEEKENKNEQGLKNKRGETPFENLHVSKGEKKRGWDLQVAGRDSIEIK